MRKIKGWLRIWIWGFCPACNSSAPNLYDCKVCNFDTHSPFSYNKRKLYWKKFKQ